MRDRSFDSTSTGIPDKLVWRMRAAQIRRHLPASLATIADYGCGSSAPLLRTLLAEGVSRRAVGVDLHPDPAAQTEALELCRAT